MLTDLNWLAEGKPWPPEDKDEAERLAEHAKNRLIYNNLHEQAFPRYGAYLRDKAEAEKKQPIILGWGEKATSNYINLCIGEEPDIEVDGENYNVERPDEEVLIDVSRYGLGLYEVTQEGIQAQNPERCYIVNTPGNMRRVFAYVFFEPFEVDKQTYIKFTIHGRGYIQHLVHGLKNNKLEALADLSSFPAYADLQVDAKGLQYPFGAQEESSQPLEDDLLIVRVDNALSSERRYGRSDYTPSVASLIEALEKAFAQREEVLATFTRPMLMAPESAFNHFNFATKKWEIKLDEPILLEPGSAEPKYGTWDASLEAVENAIQEKFDQLLQMLDLVKHEELGKAESGTALAFRLIPTTSRVRKYASSLKKAIPKVLSLDSRLRAGQELEDGSGKIQPFEPEDVSIVFQDGIPRDPLLTAQWATMAFSAGGMSLETYITITQELEPGSDALKEELDRIKGDQKAQREAAPPAPEIKLPILSQAGRGESEGSAVEPGAGVKEEAEEG